jgi:outer membrane protein
MNRRPARLNSRTPRLRQLAFALGTVCVAQFAQAQSLVELFNAAKQHDAVFQSARSSFEASQAKAAQAQAGLLPTVGLNAGTNRSHVDTYGGGPDRNFSAHTATVSASQPLYRPANRLSYEQGQKSLQVAQAQLLAAEQDLIIRTTQAYFDVLGAQDTLTFVGAQKKAVAEQLAAAKRNFEVGTSTVTDSREAQARYDLVLAQEIAAENDLRVKRLNLDTVVGRQQAEPKPLNLPVALPDVTPSDVTQWVSQAEADHPTIRQAAAALDIALMEAEKARAGHGPTLDLTAQQQLSRAPSSTTGQMVRANTATVGLQLNMPLFAGYAIQNRVKEALALEDKARNDLEGAKRGVTQATRAAFFGVQSGKGQVKALEAAEASSQSALDANLLGYQVGVRINIDVLNAQSQLYQTKRDLALARYSVILGSLKLRQANGSLTADDLVAITGLTAR